MNISKLELEIDSFLKARKNEKNNQCGFYKLDEKIYFFILSTDNEKYKINSYKAEVFYLELEKINKSNRKAKLYIITELIKKIS